LIEHKIKLNVVGMCVFVKSALDCTKC